MSPGLINHFAFLQVPHARQFTERLEFHRAKRVQKEKKSDEASGPLEQESCRERSQVKNRADFMPPGRWQRDVYGVKSEGAGLRFERFPKFLKPFCYRRLSSYFRRGEKPAIFSLRSPDLGPEQSWDSEVLKAVAVLPEGERVCQSGRR